MGLHVVNSLVVARDEGADSLLLRGECRALEEEARDPDRQSPRDVDSD